MDGTQCSVSVCLYLGINGRLMFVSECLYLGINGRYLLFCV